MQRSASLSRDFYQRAVRQNLEDVSWKASRIGELLRLQDLQPQSVVEIGGGTGRLVTSVANEFNARSLCLDLSRISLEKGKHDGVETPLCQAEAASVPLKDGVFDLCLLVDIIEHVSRPDAVLSEAGRIADLVVLKVPLERNLWRRLLEIVGLFTSDDSKRDVGHLHWWNYSDVEGLLTDYQVVAHQIICADADRRSRARGPANLVSHLRALSFRIFSQEVFRKVWGGDLLVLYRGQGPSGSDDKVEGVPVALALA